MTMQLRENYFGLPQPQALKETKVYWALAAYQALCTHFTDVETGSEW